MVGSDMEDKIQLKNRLKDLRIAKKISQGTLAEMVGVSRNTISSIETGQYSPTAKLAYLISIALDKKFEDVFYFEGYEAPDENDEEEIEASLSDKAIRRIKEYTLAHGWNAEEVLDFLIYITN